MTEQYSLGATTAARIAKNPATTADQLLSVAGISAAIDRLLAKHPNAGPALLEDLSHSSDKATRKNVALNPGTSKEALIRLAPQFPGDFFRNPAFDWLLLEDPDLLLEIGGGVLKNMLKRQDCPECFLNWAAANGSDSEKLAITMNPGAPPSVLDKLAKDDPVRRLDEYPFLLSGGRIAFAAKAHVRSKHRLPRKSLDRIFDEQVRAIFRNLDSMGWCIGRGTLTAAQLPLRSPEINWPGFRTTDHLVKEACKRGDVFYLPVAKVEAACRRRSLPARLLGLMHRLAPIDALISRCTSEEWIERMAVARNPNTPDNILGRLAGDSNRLVSLQAKATIAARHSAFERRAEKLKALPETTDLSSFRDELSRRMVVKWISDERLRSVSKASVGGLPVLTLTPVLAMRYSTEIGLDQLPERVRMSIARTLEAHTADLNSILSDLANAPEPELRQVAASSRFTPPETLLSLAKDQSVLVRRALAKNPEVTGDIFTILSNRKDREIANAVLDHPNCSPTLAVKVLLREYDVRLSGESIDIQDVLEAFEKAQRDVENQQSVMSSVVLCHPKCPPELLTSYALVTQSSVDVQASIAINPSCPPTLLAELATSQDLAVRENVAANPSCPPEVLEVLARNGDVSVSLAENPASTPTILERLAKDTNVAVRRAVASHEQCNRSTFEALATDDDFQVKWILAANPMCARSALETLAMDTELSPSIRGKPGSPMIQRAAAKNPNTPPESLLKLLDADDRYVRDATARNPNSPNSLNLSTELPLLAANDQIEVRLTAYRHPAATPESLQTWVNDRAVHPLLRVACLANSNFPDYLVDETKNSLLGQLDSPCQGQPTLDELEAALWCLDNKEATAQAMSNDWVERAASTFTGQPSSLWVLLEDPNDTVSQLAAMQLRDRMDKSEAVGNDEPRSTVYPSTGSDEDESSKKAPQPAIDSLIQ
jgi:uncharacterized protein (DUF2336 family)